MSLIVPFLLDKQDDGVTSYSDLSDKPSVNGVTLSGNKTSSDLHIDGTTDYSDLSNKPSINGVTLSGNKTTSDLHIDASPSLVSYNVASEISLNTAVASSGGSIDIAVYGDTISMIDFNVPLKSGVSFTVGSSYEVGTFTMSADHYAYAVPRLSTTFYAPLMIGSSMVGVVVFGIGTLSFYCTKQFTSDSYSRVHFAQTFVNSK